MAECHSCQKKLGFIEKKYHSKDGKLLCGSCNYKEQMIEKIEELKTKGALEIINNYCEKYKTSPIKIFSWVVGLNKNDVDESVNQDELKEIIFDILSNADIDDLDAIDVELSPEFSEFINLKKTLSVNYNIKIADADLIDILEYILAVGAKKEWH